MDLNTTTSQMKSFSKEYQMVNRVKVADEILNDGKYDAILDVVKKELNTQAPSMQQIQELIDANEFYIAEYKDLNRWGELSSVHLKTLHVEDDETQESKDIKLKLNENRKFLVNREEYQIPSKNAIYIAWAGFIALPAIYVVDNIVRLATDLYINGHEESVYISFVIVILASTWGFLKVKSNHTFQHNKYIKLRQESRELVRVGLEKGYFSVEEVYEA